MVDIANLHFAVNPPTKADDEAEPDAIGVVIGWANQMRAEGHMPDDVRAAFVAHFSFFAELDETMR